MAETSLAELERSGIYEIVNTLDGKRYIGSAKCFRIRFRVHKGLLNKGKHHAPHLQHAWAKHGAEVFEFRVIRFCELSELIECEQAAIDTLKPEYNVCPTAGSTFGRPHSAETRQKIAAKKLGIKLPPRTAEYRQRVSERFKGQVLKTEHMAALQAGRAKRVWTEEQKLAAAQSTASRYSRGEFSRDRSPEYRQKIAESLRGRTLSQEVKNKISAAQKGKKKGPYKSKTLEQRKSVCTLSDDQVLEVLNLRIAGCSQSQISEKTGIKRQQVQAICSRKLYEWVAPELIIPAFKRNPWDSEEHRQKMKALHKARWSATLIERNIEKAARLPKQKPPPPGGWKFPQDVRDKMASAKLGKPWIDAQRAARTKLKRKDDATDLQGIQPAD